MTQAKFLQDVISIVGCFDPNAYMAEEIDKYIEALSENELSEIKEHMTNLIRKNDITARDIYNMTSFKPTDDKMALNFFTAVYLFAFESGEEPDIDDYRPEWSI
jgi:hypothetical protein